MSHKKHAFAFVIAMLFASINFAQILHPLSGEYEKIQGSENYLIGGGTYTFNSEVGQFIKNDDQVSASYYSNNIAVGLHSQNEVYSITGDDRATRQSPVVYIDTVKIELSQNFYPYYPRTPYFGYGEKALYINGAYYFQFNDFEYETTSDKNSIYYKHYKISKGVCIWDGVGTNVEYMPGTKYEAANHWNFYDIIETGVNIKENLFFTTKSGSGLTNLWYYPKNTDSVGIDIGSAVYVSFIEPELNLDQSLVAKLAQTDTSLIYLFQNKNYYTIGEMSCNDSIETGVNNGIKKYKYIFKTLASASKDYGYVASYDKNAVILKKNDTLFTLNIAKNIVDTTYIPVDFEGEILKPFQVYGGSGDTVLFNKLRDKSESVYYWNGTEITKLLTKNFDDYYFENGTAGFMVYNNDIYFSYYSGYTETGLLKVKDDTLMPVSGNTDGFLQELSFEELGDYAFFNKRYQVGIIGAYNRADFSGCQGVIDTLTIDVAEGASIQWYKNNKLVDGATSTHYVTNFADSLAEVYAQVSLNGTVQNASIRQIWQSMSNKPEFTDKLLALGNCSGKTGEIQLSYKINNGTRLDSTHWFYNNNLLDIETNGDYYVDGKSLKIHNLDKDKVGLYHVVLFGGYCQYSAYSDTVKLDTLGNAKILTTLSDQKACEGIGFEISLIAQESDGSAVDYVSTRFSADGISYGTSINGMTNQNSDTSIFNLLGFQAQDTGYYFMEVNGKCNTISSDTIEVTLGKPYTITNKLNLDTVDCMGSQHTLKVGVASEGNIVYQWLLNNVEIADANDSIYQIALLDSTSIGVYTVNVAGDCQNDIAGSASLAIKPSTVFSLLPAGISDCAETEHQLSVMASSTDSLSYQWLHNGAAINSATDSVFTISSLNTNAVGTYSVNVLTACYNDTVGAANVEMLKTTAILKQPSNASITEGEDFELSVEAEGAGDINYQWKHEGIAIDDATTNLFSISGATISDEGKYSVSVSAACGSAESDDATLSISVVGINRSLNNLLNIYPNPVNSVLNISSSVQITKIELVNTKGQLIQSNQNGFMFYTFDLSYFKSGIYFLNVHTNSGKAIYKIVKE